MYHAAIFEWAFRKANFILDYNNLQKLAYPVIVDLTNETNQILNQTEKYIHIQKIYKNISDLLSSHLSARENKNRWSSQFEMPVYPWLLPCANFPLCKTQDIFHEDFSDIMKHDLDTWHWNTWKIANTSEMEIRWAALNLRK